MAMPKKKGPKSHKADGTPKKRWSATERAARGHGPRHRGGQSGASEQRFGKGRSGGYSRPGEDFDSNRSERGQDRQREDRFAKGDDRQQRGGFVRRDRFGDSQDRRGRRDFSRDDRFGQRQDRGERGGFDRRDRFGARPDRDGRDFGSRDRFDGRKDQGDFGRQDRFDGRKDRGDFAQRDNFGDRKAGYQRRDDRFAEQRGPRSQGREFSRDDRFAPRSNDRFAGRDDRFAGRRDRDNFGRDDRRGHGSREPRHFVGDGRDRRGPARDFTDRGGRHRDDYRKFDRAPREHREHEASEEIADQMSWSATEVVAAEVTEADQASGFAELGVALPIIPVLAAKGITAPFPIQSATIADAIAGRDVLGRGRTGSGKTLAFGLSMLTRLADGKPTGTPRAMILTPTRELALQIADVLAPLGAAVGLDLTLIAGGMAYGPQIRAFERGVDVVVATPGRLIDLLEQGAVDLSGVEVTVLDEADHMSDLGFLPAVKTLLNAAGEGQRLLFSATLDGAVDRLVREYLHDPVTHEVDSDKASVTTMTHHLLQLAPHHKNLVTAEIANRDGKTVVFARTQMGADRIAGQLREAGVMAGALHGGLTQGARARILAAFKEDHLPVLVATDVAARGIHVDDVSLVLQVDPPMGPKDYLHRAGRTARAGETGAVVSLVLPHQRKQIRRLVGQAGVKAAPVDIEPGSVELREATGARPASGTPISDEDYQVLIAPKAQQRRRPRHDGGYGGYRGGNRRGGRSRGRW